MPITKEMGTDADLVENTAKLNTQDSAALKDIMKKRLTECGWRKDIEQMIRQTIEEHGVGNLTRAQLAEKIVPQVGTCLGPRSDQQGDADACALRLGIVEASGEEMKPSSNEDYRD